MNILTQRTYQCAIVALLLAIVPLGYAQPAPATPPSEPSPTQSSPAAPPIETPGESPATAPDGPSAPKSGDRSGLREIGQTDGQAEERRESGEAIERRSETIVNGSHRVLRGRRTGEVVSFLESTTISGEVESDVVSIAGPAIIESTGKVGGAVVTIFGRLESRGEIGDEAVSVMGSATIDGPIGGDAVAVMGNMHLGPKAVIDGDIVVIGGRLHKDPNAIVRGDQVNIPVLGGFGDMDWLTNWITHCAFKARPLALGENLHWAWMIALSFFGVHLLLALLFPRGVVTCAETLETRPGYTVLSSVLTVLLTPVALVLLSVTVVGALLVPFLGVGLLLAKLFGKAVMLAWIGRRFTKLIGDGPLSHPIFAVLIGGLIVLLLYTIPVIGFMTYALLSWLGLGVTVYTIVLAMKRQRPPATPAGTPPIGPTPAAPFGTQPTYPAAPMTPVPPSSSIATGVPSGVVAAPTVSPGFGGSGGTTSAANAPVNEPGVASSASSASADVPLTPPPTSLPPPAPPIPPEAAFPPPVQPPLPPAAVTAGAAPTAWQPAGFFVRLGALALDGILIGLIMALFSGLLPRFLRFHEGPGPWLIVLAIYGAVMWKHRGTTIGGIVCGLKVVRADNREIDWATAIVRALGCFLSLAVVGLGFIWVAIDAEKQSWHDKIAGTRVVRVPKGVSLL